MKRYFTKKRVLAVMLACLLTIQVLFALSPSTVHADSNDRREALIQMSKNKDFSNIPDLENMTYDDLRVIGVFLSNFYVPWSTAIGVSSAEDKVKEEMVTALVDQCGFNKNVAEALVPMVWDMALSTAQPLEIAKYEVDDSEDNELGYIVDKESVNGGPLYIDIGGWVKEGDTWVEQIYNPPLGEHDGFIANAYTFMLITSGSMNEERTVNDFADYKDWCMYWTDGEGVDHVVWTSSTGDVDGQGNEFSASTVAYGMLADQLNYEFGLGGNSLLACKSIDFYNELSKPNKARMLLTQSKFYVSCFGDILCDTGIDQLVVLPACANPYSWYEADDVKTAGENVNLINTYLIGEAESEHITFDRSADTYDYYFYTGFGSLFNLNYWRVYRGMDKISIDANISLGGWGNSEETTTLLELASIRFESEAGADSIRFFNWATFAESMDDGNEIVDYLKADDFNGDLYDGAFSDMCMIDNLGAFQDSEESDMDIITTVDLFDGYNNTALLSGMTNATSFLNVQDSNDVIRITGSKGKQYLISVFLSYVYAYYDTATGEERKVEWAYNKNAFPSDFTNIDWSNIEMSTDGMQLELMSMAYYIMHPTEGGDFISSWFKTKASAIILGWHEDMAGSSAMQSSSGATKYANFSGYVTVPNLSDLEWTNFLLKNYNNLVVYAILAVIIILFLYTMIGGITYQKAITGILIFSFCIYLPPTLINTTIDIANQICDNIYGEKFTYWALVQHEQYVSAVNGAITEDNKQDYLGTVFASQAQQASNDPLMVTLKWICPKKDNYMASIKSEITEVSGSENISGMIGNLISGQISGESYTNEANSLYLYRSYPDISSYANRSYSADVEMASVDSSGINQMMVANGDDLLSVFTSYVSNSPFGDKDSMSRAIVKGFSVDTTDNMGLVDSKTNKRYYSFMGNKAVPAAVSKGIEDIGLNPWENNMFGLEQSLFNTTLKDVVKTEVTSQAYSRFVYGIYTESPFYYFSYNLNDQINSTSPEILPNLANSSNPYKDLFLLENGGYFYNTKVGMENTPGYGEMRDYMDMRSLFTLVIPYLKSANNVVVEWDNIYGLWLYDNITLEYDENNDLIIPAEITDAGSESELYQKYRHNANVAQLFNMYTPWVDVMYDCNYAKAQFISVAGNRFMVNDPIDPSSYNKKDASGNITEGRQMIFSRSEMEYYGLDMADLTTVEKKILYVQDNSYKKVFALLDYFTFEDEVINTGAAMLETFEFSKEFSQTSIIGEDYILYPQSYELKNFSYDSYLRLILTATTSEPLQSTASTDLYKKIVDDSSILTGILILVLDMMAIYLIPLCKLIFVLSIFTLSVIMILAATLRIELKMSSLLVKSLITPLLSFFAITVGLAFVVSLFMSDGNTAVTGRGNFVISLKDPAMVVIAMIGINAVAMVLYFKTLVKVAKDTKTYGNMVFNTMKGIVGGSMATALTAITAGAGAAKAAMGLSKGAVGSVKGAGGSIAHRIAERVEGNHQAKKTGKTMAKQMQKHRQLLIGRRLSQAGKSKDGVTEEQFRARMREKAKERAKDKNKYDTASTKPKPSGNKGPLGGRKASSMKKSPKRRQKQKQNAKNRRGSRYKGSKKV